MNLIKMERNGKLALINKIQCQNEHCKMFIDPDEDFVHVVKYHPKALQLCIDSVNAGEFITNPMKTFFKKV